LPTIDNVEPMTKVEPEEEKDTMESSKGIQEILAKYDVSPWLLDPRSKRMKRWDSIIALALLYTALLTPYEIAFLDMKPASKIDVKLSSFVLYCINWVVDLTFLTDLIFNFNLIYFDPELANGTWIVDRYKIVYRYLTGFCIIDVISIIPFGEMDAGNLKALKLLRLLRLFKLLRILRSGRILKRLEDNINIDYNVLTLCKFIIGTLFIAHWLACMFQLLTRIVSTKTDWVTNYFSAHHDPGFEMGLCMDHTDHFETNSELRACLHVSPFATYIAALYWALVTMSTIGYGDIVPTGTEERFFIIFAMLIGTSVFAYVVGSVCGIVANMDKKNAAFMELMDDLNAFMRATNLDVPLRYRLRDYFRYRHKGNDTSIWTNILTQMSPKLRGEVAIKQCGEWINNVPFFIGAPKQFVVDIALKLTSVTYPQDEEILRVGEFSTQLYIVERGVVGGKGRVFTSGKVFGEEVLGGGVAGFTARAMTYCDLFVLDGSELEGVSNSYPRVQLNLRKAACRSMAKESLTAFTKAWAQIIAGNKTSPDLEYDQDGPDSTAAEQAIRVRSEKVFKFSLDLYGNASATTQKPAFPAAQSIAQMAAVTAAQQQDAAAEASGEGEILAAIKQLRTYMDTRLAGLESKIAVLTAN